MHQAKIWTRLHRTTCTHPLAFFFPFCNGRNAALPLLFLVFFFGRSLRRCVTSTWKWPAFFLLLSHSLSLIYRNADTSAAGHHHRHHLLSRQAAYTERHVSKAIARIKIYIYFLSLTFLFFLCAIVFFFLSVPSALLVLWYFPSSRWCLCRKWWRSVSRLHSLHLTDTAKQRGANKDDKNKNKKSYIAPITNSLNYAMGAAEKTNPNI